MDIYFYTVKLAKFLALVQTYNGGFYSGQCPIEQRDIIQTSSDVPGSLVDILRDIILDLLHHKLYKH